MSALEGAVPPVVIGVAFGWLLQKAGMSRYERIVNVFRFRDFAVVEFLLSALVTASIGIQALQSLGFAADVPVPATHVAANLVGGVVFGVGMALSGFCPGTVAAGAGEGRLDYLVPGGIGLYSGAVIYGLAYEHVLPALSRLGPSSKATVSELLSVEPWLVVVLFAEVALLILYAARQPSRPNAGSAPHRARFGSSPLPKT